MKTIQHLTEALLNAATLAANGKANLEQTQLLCNCTDTLIRLARFELEARNWATCDKPIVLGWIEEGNPTKVVADAAVAVAEPNGSRITSIEKEITRAKQQLQNRGISATTKAELEDKIQNWEDRLKFLKATCKPV